MGYKKISSLPILVIALLVTGTTTAFSLNTTNSEKSSVYLANAKNTTTQKVLDTSNSKGIANNKNLPLAINNSKIQFDDSPYHWPSNVISFKNNSKKAIMDYEIVCLAYDKNGKPLELYWDAQNVATNGEVGSVGFSTDGVDYGIVAGISPVSKKAYAHTYRRIQQSPPKDIISMFEKQQGKAWVEKWLKEWQQMEKEYAKQNAIVPNKTQNNENLLFDKWNQSTGKHDVKYIISCVKQVTFSDGSVWKNSEYESWAKDFQGKSVSTSVLENYYK
ncbi:MULTISPECIES: DUF5780 domain-containing protein [unclassified Clostridioides]|uniref:DUF5780 domain-containing protein n=2 Tax=Clostridioides TaxID=1870884 RepID=UPI001D12B16F|nr:hypothetical protein [Clostridioides sp. ZZV14-6153]MCC0728880.1 hypothetical protein [Clostridioides sp. ZZV14-6045]MCC0731773.1 hypothetical protein [Clostridioides sp. ZZV14-6048]MCC0733607.1 hypothetical protein [Clostridioides sp. ZZV14-6009]MCC0738333.1 hypothetical protein [Clostridioides sp. ZZV14-5902]